MNKIFLLGVYHCFQTKECTEFLNYVRSFCVHYSINSIGEEMNDTALCVANRDKSVVKMIADDLWIPHAYCDPDENESNALGILREDKLKLLKFQNEWTDEEFECRKALSAGMREPIWLERLQKIFIDPMLFVCGISHLKSFSTLLEANGFSFQIDDRKWTPKDMP